MAALGISHQDATPVAEYFLKHYNTLNFNRFRSYKVTNNEQTRVESMPYVEYSGNTATLVDFLQAYTTPTDEHYKPLIINYLKHTPKRKKEITEKLLLQEMMYEVIYEVIRF